MCHRGSFREDIYKKCVLCKDADNGLEHVVNECAKLKNERKQLLKDLNNINNRKDTELLKAIEFHYYSKSYTNKKGENKDDNKGIKLIKEFVETLYKEMTEERNKRELQLLMHLVLLFTVQVMHQVYKVYLFLILNISRFADLTKLN